MSVIKTECLGSNKSPNIDGRCPECGQAVRIYRDRDGLRTIWPHQEAVST